MLSCLRTDVCSWGWVQPRLDWNFDDVKAIAKLFQTNTHWSSHIKSYHNLGGRCTNRAAIMSFTYRVRLGARLSLAPLALPCWSASVVLVVRLDQHRAVLASASIFSVVDGCFCWPVLCSVLMRSQTTTICGYATRPSLISLPSTPIIRPANLCPDRSASTLATLHRWGCCEG